jgi:hypothetical protein
MEVMGAILVEMVLKTHPQGLAKRQDCPASVAPAHSLLAMCVLTETTASVRRKTPAAGSLLPLMGTAIVVLTHR